MLASTSLYWEGQPKKKNIYSQEQTFQLMLHPKWMSQNQSLCIPAGCLIELSFTHLLSQSLLQYVLLSVASQRLAVLASSNPAPNSARPGLAPSKSGRTRSARGPHRPCPAGDRTDPRPGPSCGKKHLLQRGTFVSRARGDRANSKPKEKKQNWSKGEHQQQQTFLLTHL